MSLTSVFYCNHKKLVLLLDSDQQAGFTLVELIIVIAIIGILSAVATVSYQTHVRKTNVMNVYKELNHHRLTYEVGIAEGQELSQFNLNGLNIPMQTKHCLYSVNSFVKGSVTHNAIRCQIRSLSYLSNQTLNLDRAIDGTWSCRASSGISRAYLPLECRLN